jgi:hypothetical protein
MGPALPLLALALGGIMLALKKAGDAASASAQSSTGPPAGAIDPSGQGEWIVTPATVPAGFRRVLGSEVTPELTTQAKRILKEHGADPIGTTVPFESNAKQFLGVIEMHYHEPGGPLKPWGPHHGVSLFVEA